MADDPIISWRQRKVHLKAAARESAKSQKKIKKTNAWRRLKREAQEAAQNPNNLHDGFSR